MNKAVFYPNYESPSADPSTMLAYLSGTIIEVLTSSVILQTGGMGYEVFLTGPVLQKREKGNEASFYIHHHIREDQQTLYGFSLIEERSLFQKMISVSGIGPKSAMAALSASELPVLVKAIQLEDHAVFQSVPGIGPKTAKRLVLELRSKVEWDDSGAKTVFSQRNSMKQDLAIALEQLGYQPAQIREAVNEIEDSLELEHAMKKALQNLQK